MSPESQEQMRRFIELMMGMRGQKRDAGEMSGGGRGGLHGNCLALDERLFRRCEKLSGDSLKFRAWIFALMVVLSQVDGELQRNAENLLRSLGRLWPDATESNLGTCRWVNNKRFCPTPL